MRRVTTNRLLIFAGTAISFLALYAIFSRVSWHELKTAFLAVSPMALLGAILVTLLSYGLRAARWRYLVPPGMPVCYATLLRATILGYMANTLLPARLGELVRAWALARTNGSSVATVLASLVTDRLWDGLSVLVMLLTVLFVVELPAHYTHLEPLLVRSGMVMLVAYGIIIAIVALVSYKPSSSAALVRQLTHSCCTRFGDKVAEMLLQFAGAVRFTQGGLYGTIMVAFLSGLIWLTATLPVYFLITGSGLTLPFGAPLLIMVLLVFAVMVPAAPGAIGTFHLACTVGLAAYGVTTSSAVSLAILLHVCGYLPITVIGLVLLWGEGGGLLQLYRSLATGERV